MYTCCGITFQSYQAYADHIKDEQLREAREALDRMPAWAREAGRPWWQRWWRRRLPRKPTEFVNHPWAFPGGVYRGFCHHIVDGDTFDALVDLGLYHYAYQPFRLKDYNAWETNKAAEREHGLVDKAALELILLNKPILITAFKDVMTFDRYVASVQVYIGNSIVDVVQYLKDSGYGKPIS